MITRNPAEIGTPGCYALYRGDERCKQCEFANRCEKHSDRLSQRLTLLEATNRATNAYKAQFLGDAVTSDELVILVSQLWAEKGGRTHGWGSNTKWHKAMEIVVAACTAAGWDPRTYVRAHAEQMGWFCQQKGLQLAPNMFVGAKASDRFKRWVTRNTAATGEGKRDRTLDPEREILLSAECMFAHLYIPTLDQRASEVEAVVRERYPEWTLKRTKGIDHVRLPALSGAAAGVHPSIPHRLLLPEDGNWIWPEARQAVHDLFTNQQEPAEELPDALQNLDPRLGTFL